MKKQVIAYLHTHWDREWYREFEVFRIRLLRVFDNVLEMLENNKIPSFYFDGQVIALKDYLDIRPEKFELVKTLISQKKLFIGPFYCLADEFLTDEICFRKNLDFGLEYAKSLGCTDFLAYFADTFGHSKNLIPIIKEYGIDKAMVWRGCGDIPAEFVFNGLNTVNLIRGYFMDLFSAPFDYDKKTQLIKENLDKIAEKSGDVLLLPIGADHLGVETDITEQIEIINSKLDDYQIKLGSPFEYFDLVKDNFKFNVDDELRDNSKTFILQGSYSSRMDLKKLNVECSYKLDFANRLQKCFSLNYDNVIKHAYEMLLQNQAHDSICGCSTDLVHSENKMRYNKILQIAQTIFDEVRFKMGSSQIINVGEKPFSGIVEFESVKELSDFQLISTRKGFENEILQDTQRIPVTEDYRNIYTYIAEVENLKSNEVQELKPIESQSDLVLTDNSIENSKIALKVIGNNIIINNDISLEFVDFIDEGDSYNNGPIEKDEGVVADIISVKKLMEGNLRCGLKITTSFFDVDIFVDRNSPLLSFKIDWNNDELNHLVQARFVLNDEVSTTYSEDANSLIERHFDPKYDIRKNLPKTRGFEAKTNTAPMQRFVWANDLGIITKGITEYEVFQKTLSITLLRATGIISNPKNSSRSTPAGPPIPTNDLQQLGRNLNEFSIYCGALDDWKDNLDKVYPYVLA